MESPYKVAHKLAQRLVEQEANGLTRRHRIVEGPQQIKLQIDGRELTSFCSNDYLGLANHPDVKQAFKEGVDQYGVGSGAAHLISGHTRAHHLLEEELAAYTGYERALLFSTGYMANLAMLSTLADRHDVIYQDKLNHASLIDGGQLGRATVRRYRHADFDDLSRLIKTDGAVGGLLATDGVFSMEGDIAPLDQLSEIAHRNDLMLIVDDAHGLGVLGEGKGTAAHYSLTPAQVPLLMGTLGKALGTFGAFVAGSAEVIESLVQFARSYMYTTAPPPAIAEATRASLSIVQSDGDRRARLAGNIRYFRKAAARHGIPTGDSRTPIQPIAMAEIDSLLRVQSRLEEKGFLVSAIRPPTAPQARLRVTLCSEHQYADIDGLVVALSGALSEAGDG